MHTALKRNLLPAKYPRLPALLNERQHRTETIELAYQEVPQRKLLPARHHVWLRPRGRRRRLRAGKAGALRDAEKSDTQGFGTQSDERSPPAILRGRRPPGTTQFIRGNLDPSCEGARQSRVPKQGYRTILPKIVTMLTGKAS